MVDGAVVDGEMLAVESDVLDRDLAGGDPVGGESAADGRRIDGSDPGDARQVVGHVPPGPEADFEHVAAEAFAGASAKPLHGLAAQCNVDDAGKNLALVEAHHPSPIPSRASPGAGRLDGQLSARPTR